MVDYCKRTDPYDPNAKPTVLVLIWIQKEMYEKAWIGMRKAKPHERFVYVKLNGEWVYYTPSTGIHIDEVPKKKKPQGFIEIESLGGISNEFIKKMAIKHFKCLGEIHGLSY